jgi:hypothetical protein
MTIASSKTGLPIRVAGFLFAYLAGFASAQDYKLISSNFSYVELEYYPEYHETAQFISDNEYLTRINFRNSESKQFPGEPDLRFRSLPVILPSINGNSVTITESDFEDLKNVNLAPFPSVRFIDPNRRDFENIEVHYLKNPPSYSVNEFLPQNAAALENIGEVRDMVIGSVLIFPYQYNPAMRVLRKYSRIRVRINFGAVPILSARKRSRTELELLSNIAINWSTASDWSRPSVPILRENARLENSKMAAGDWYRIEIRDNGSGGSEGIYKITKQFLESAGINLSNVDPRTIKMYGNGGDLLPESPTAARPQDLEEIAIYIEGEGNGHFDPQDYILFYGRSVNNWKYNPQTRRFSHYINYYSNSNYYWIQLNTPGFGRRMASVLSENVQNPYTPQSFAEKIFFETEINNLLMEGNMWLSQRISDGQSFSWAITQTGLEPNSNIYYRLRLASRVFAANSYTVREENSTMSEIIVQLQAVPTGWDDWIRTAVSDFTINASQKNPPNTEQSRFVATFHSPLPEGEGYLDWMEIQYLRKFSSVANDLLRFTSPDTAVVVQYTLSPFSNNQIRIFDVTDHDSAAMIQPLNLGPNYVTFQKSAVQGSLKKYIAAGPNGYKAPTGISQRFANQNLHGFQEGASFVIVTDRSLSDAASQLKQKRESGGPSNFNFLKTQIVFTDQIYNEFGGGLPDAVAIRDYLKYAWDYWQEKPVYVLLFGDGHLDYRKILGLNGNLVPPYEYTTPNIHQVIGFTSDDFYTWMADGYPRPSFAIGRIPVTNQSEASSYLDKLDCYEDPAYNGYWKNKSAYAADDGWTTNTPCEGPIHTHQIERLAEIYTPQVFEKLKIYLVAYPSIITSQGRRKPGVTADMIKYWNLGLATMSYAGHGAPLVWAHEYVLEAGSFVSQLNNNCKYPLLTVASCDFSKFDNPMMQSGGEIFVTAPGKGAISSVAATRPTYPGDNEALNNALFQDLFFHQDTLLLQKRFGRGLFYSKHTVSYNPNAYKYILMGDPSVRFRIPRFRSSVDSIAGLKDDTMRALSRIEVYGSVLKPDSTLWTDFNGNIFLKIFDVPDNLLMTPPECPRDTFRFTVSKRFIFSGSKSVRNGKWNVQFIVPKDISYLNRKGKLTCYFYNSSADGSGLDTSFIIGGIDPLAPADSNGPEISLYLNNRDFRSGDIVNENFKLLGDFFDESGINTTGSIGHKIEATLDGDVNQKYDLTTFYSSDTTYQRGSLEYDFLSIPEGEHRLSLKAFDTYNNSSEAEIRFVVSSYNGLKVVNVYNYPNPFTDNTVFTFQHNYPDAINVRIKIYTVAGRLIKQLQQNGINDKFVAINWSGKDEDSETLSNGIYIYRLTVEAGDGSSITETGKLAVLK